MGDKKILILDYSVRRSEAALIRRWLPEDARVTSLFIDSAESFPDQLVERDYTCVIHSGSELSVTEAAPFTQKAVNYIQGLKDRHIPQMGICYGHQLICRSLLGPHAVRKSSQGLEAGWCAVSFIHNTLRIPGISKTETLWQHHLDEVIDLPEGSHLIATNSHTRIQAYVHTELRLFGTQFHPEYDRKKGNEFFLEDRGLLEAHDYHVDEIIKQGPSIESGKIFFNFFLDYFQENTD